MDAKKQDFFEQADSNTSESSLTNPKVFAKFFIQDNLLTIGFQEHLLLQQSILRTSQEGFGFLSKMHTNFPVQESCRIAGKYRSSIHGFCNIKRLKRWKHEAATYGSSNWTRRNLQGSLPRTQPELQLY